MSAADTARERVAGEPLDEALAHCYRHLGSRDHSVAELRARLERAKLEASTIEQALSIVSEQGYLDDTRYARGLIEDRRNIDGWGVDRIRARLQRAGIDGELIDELLARFDTAAELAAAQALLERRARVSLRGDDERRRAFAILIRAGYDSDVAYDAIRATARRRGEDLGED